MNLTTALLASLTLAAAIVAEAAARLSTFCPLRCRCNDAELTVNCQDAALDVFPLTLHPMLKEIRLSRNNIANILSAFGVYSQLEVLDLSANRISNLGENNFALVNLRELDLSYNFIKELFADTFQGAESLQTLVLKKNSLTELPANVFKGLRSIEVIDLSNNHISVIHPAAFTGLATIKRLVLRANHFRSVPTESFVHLNSLRSLDLGSNALSMLDEAAFTHLRNLEELELDKCGIAQVDAGSFLELGELRTLNLQYNNIQSFPLAISTIEKLEDLNIGGNLIARLSAKDLRKSYRLRKITMSHSEMLQRIDDDAFQANLGLEEVVFEFNMQLERIPTNLFGGLANLRRVSLRGNSIRTIDAHTLPIDLLASFDLTKNPLECNCQLMWLWQYLRSDYVVSMTTNASSMVRCGGPEALRSSLLMNLDADDLECGGDTKRGLLVGGLTILCSVLLAIGGVLLWYRRRAPAHLMTSQDPVKALKQLENGGTSVYAQYQDSRYPYVLQPTRIPTLPTPGMSYAKSMMLTPKSSPNGGLSLPACLAGGRNSGTPGQDNVCVDTSNHAYQTLGSALSSASSECESAKYFTLDGRGDQNSSLYVDEERRRADDLDGPEQGRAVRQALPDEL
ncbi:slit1 protein-like, partial [Tropilaelaps mercedesae]